MKYDFDKIIERKGTRALKWESVENIFGNKEVLPMWVADMDFLTPLPVIDAINKKAKHGIYGYTERSKTFYSSIINWVEKEYGWKINEEWIVYTPGVVMSLYIAIEAYTKSGQKAIVQTPIYPPFLYLLRNI